ncbi:MAG: nuclear transport factor 2 family protein [Gammaproteobacteria bacterium]|nr:nuclear transport factor 2 family protein [Gammaproteobacteria bacterium]
MSEHGSIESTLELYFDALFEGDTDKVRRVFHQNAHLYSATGGEYVDIPLDDYVSLVAGRPSPESQGAARTGEVLDIDQSGPHSALAKVALTIGKRRFVDYLTLLKVDGRWVIAAKAFHFEE